MDTYGRYSIFVSAHIVKWRRAVIFLPQWKQELITDVEQIISKACQYVGIDECINIFC